jgi:bifunctional enzyme CysN/CysC
MNEVTTRERLNIVIAGHVDHGKSTIVGRLLADSGALPDGKLAQVKAYCDRNAKPFEYAFLVDALKNEQAQGVTIDSARVFFRAGNREYVLMDAPGHVDFVRNMVTGASRADAALLVIDANEGIQENSRRHGKLLGLLGIRQVVVLVNKMDLVGFAQATFDTINGEYSAFLREAGVTPIQFIPVSGMRGDNIVQSSSSMPWYSGATVVEVLKNFRQEESPSEKPFRLWVQGVYKFTNDGDTRRIVAGTVESGMIRVGDRIVFYPSGKKSTVKNIESFPASTRSSATAGEAIGVTLSEQIYVTRGELAIKVGESRPHVTSRLRSSIFWLGKQPMLPQREYLLKVGTARVPCTIESVHSVQDASTLATSESRQLDRYTVADCDLQLDRAAAFDLSDDVLGTGRFAIVDEFEIRGGGIIREPLVDTQSRIREKVLLRDYKWEMSSIPGEQRAARHGQKPAVIIITGKRDCGKKPLARALEASLHREGYEAYFLGIANVLYGVDADIKREQENREEHMRRLSEVAHIMLEAGFILIVTAIELRSDDLEIIRTSLNPHDILVVLVGDRPTVSVEADVAVPDPSEASLATLLARLLNSGITGNERRHQGIEVSNDIQAASTSQRVRTLKVLSSLPRSGTHWLKFMISELLGEPAYEEKRLLDETNLKTALETIASKRLVYEHFESDLHAEILNPQKYPGLRMVVLYRNPLDVYISYYYANARDGKLKNPQLGAMENFKADLLEFARSYELAIEPQERGLFSKMGIRWDVRVHVIDWLNQGWCLPVRYEDLVDDPAGQLGKIAQYMEIPCSSELIAKAVAKYTFEALSGGRLRGVADPNSHYRRGTPGEWMEVYDEQMLKAMRTLIGDYLAILGYAPEHSVE